MRHLTYALLVAAIVAGGIVQAAAEKLTGIAHTDLSRIRNAKLDRFTLDRMITILGKLDRNAEVRIDVKSRGPKQMARAAG